MHGLKVVVKGGVPAVKGDEEEAGERTSAPDRAVEEEVEWDEGLSREELLVESKGNDAENSDDEHGDDHGSVPAFSLVRGEGEGQEE